MTNMSPSPVNTANFCSMCGAPRYHGHHWAKDLNDLANTRAQLKTSEVALHKERNTNKDQIIKDQQEEIIRLRAKISHLNNSWLQNKCAQQARAITRLEEKVKSLKGLPYAGT